MLWKLIFASVMAVNTLGEYSPSLDTLLLARAIPGLNLFNNYPFDGPAAVSHAPTTPTANKKPTLEQLMYYNYYAAAMYCQYELYDLDCDVCQNFNKDVDSHAVLMNNHSDTTALVTLSNSRKEVVVTYRGTQNFWNVVQDSMFFNHNLDGGFSGIKLHTGFYAATMSLYSDVVKNVGYLQSLHKDYTVVIVGHSLGAAMARIFYFLLLYVNQFPGVNYELYAYGEPRVGNKAFADFINNQTITTARIVAKSDIVPHVPPTSNFGTTVQGDYYIHPQPEYWINGESSRFCDLTVYEDPTCSDSLGPSYNVADHILYLDVNYGICYFNQPLLLAALPFNIFQPVGTVPPLPKLISNFIGSALTFLGVGK